MSFPKVITLASRYESSMNKSFKFPSIKKAQNEFSLAKLSLTSKSHITPNPSHLKIQLELNLHPKNFGKQPMIALNPILMQKLES